MRADDHRWDVLQVGFGGTESHFPLYSVTDYLMLSEGLRRETSRPMMSELLDQLEYVEHDLTSDQDQPQYFR